MSDSTSYQITFIVVGNSSISIVIVVINIIIDEYLCVVVRQ